MGTRERIVDTAIWLFNEEGTGPVSTNHIARAAGISPGNLSYHFRNKEEILRAIYARLRPAWEAAVALPGDRTPTIADLHRIVREHFRLVWAYRFYYREMPALLRRDPELERQYQEVRQAGLANVEALLRRLAAADILDLPDADGVAPELARICWILADFWLPFAELGPDAIGPDDLDRGVTLILRALHPYVTAAAMPEIARLERSGGEPAGGAP